MSAVGNKYDISDEPKIQALYRLADKTAPTDASVLITGETGVGKEVLAEYIFSHSRRADKPFVKINCSAIPKDLLESELFGHEKGAFTGASATKKGKFEMAAGGVLLLDEIGEMSYELQSKLLRVLEAKEFERIGGSRVIPMRARIIASTNQNLKQLVADGKFRMDLYYRLSTFEITIPPLRAHKSDIPLLINHFRRIDGLNLEFNEDAKGMLMNYVWPGNVRELRNVLNRLSFLYPNTIIGVRQVYDATGDMFHLVKLPEYRKQTDPLPRPTMPKYGETAVPTDPIESAPGASTPPEVIAPADGTLAEQMEAFERTVLQRAVAEAKGNLAAAASALNISRATIYNKVKKYGITI